MMMATSSSSTTPKTWTSGWRALRSREGLVVVATRPLRTWPPWRGEALDEARKVVEEFVLDGLPPRRARPDRFDESGFGRESRV